MNNDELFLKAITTLREEMSSFVPSSEFDELEKKLKDLLDINCPNSISITNAMLEIQKVESARVWLKSIIGDKNRFDQPLGKSLPVEPGPLMICPKDPNHPTRFLRVSGQVLICKICKAKLIPS